MSGAADREEAGPAMSTWPIERLQAFITDARDRGQLEAARVVAQQHVYYDVDQPREVRRQWAKVSLLANRRMRGDGPGDPAREVQQDFMLRMWVIDHLGGNEDPDWSPEGLAADTLDALALAPSDAGTLAGNWRGLPVEQIRELRRHKNLTTHLDRLISHLPSDRTRDQLLMWIETRRLLP
ncbi:hypothetical protein [Streptomyces sp. NPDC047869]|uniref:hypothetical protein n=1 Tax=Streptomyces sp. NPDC047869 TaxID=3154709 RepID=UPI0034515B54